MTKIQLTPAQRAILAYAIQHTGGKIEWFPDNIKGGAREGARRSHQARPDCRCRRRLARCVWKLWRAGP